MIYQQAGNKMAYAKEASYFFICLKTYFFQ